MLQCKIAMLRHATARYSINSLSLDRKPRFENRNSLRHRKSFTAERCSKGDPDGVEGVKLDKFGNLDSVEFGTRFSDS